MNPIDQASMLEATRLTQAGRLAEATELLQRLLCGQAMAADIATPPPAIEAPAPAFKETLKEHLPESMRGLLDRVLRRGSPEPELQPEPVADGARFLSGTYAEPSGQRNYRLYIPSSYRNEPVPLVVMLHGCTQSPEDFAAGTGMNRLAETHNFLVLYPGQDQAANPSRCWNWFSPADQRRGSGEPALIAGATRKVMREFAVDPRRVYIAGLSAGGGAASIMADAYPDLYAAVGVHSGLASGAASDLPSALVAMRRGAEATVARDRSGRTVPTIVFHGDQDTTVHPRNGEAVVDQAAAGEPLETREETGRSPGGLTWRRVSHVDSQGRTIIEHWVVEDAGHAWSGGSPAGSYTDPRGPDASAEMVRFFLDHRLPE